MWRRTTRQVRRSGGGSATDRNAGGVPQSLRSRIGPRGRTEVRCGGRPAPPARSATSKSRELFVRSPEITGDDLQVGLGGSRPVQACVNDPSTSFDGNVVAEIVGGLKNVPGRIERLVRRRLIGGDVRAFVCGCAARDSVLCDVHA